MVEITLEDKWILFGSGDHVHFENVFHGVYLYVNSHNNYVSDNIIYDNALNGIKVYQSSNNSILSNSIFENAMNTLYHTKGVQILSDSQNNFVSDNIIYDNNGPGIGVDNSNNNHIEGNSISNNTLGIAMSDVGNDNTIQFNEFEKFNSNYIWFF